MSMEFPKPHTQESKIDSMNNREIAELLDSLFFRSLFDSQSLDERLASIVWLKSFLKNYNLSPEKILSAWGSNASPRKYGENSKEEYTFTEAREDFKTIVTENISCIKEIEQKYPGISQDLNREYGILNFGRFRPEVWIKQYEERKLEKPFGLVVAARSDWNGGSYTQAAEDAYQDLFEKMQPEFSLKIIEAKSIPELAKFITKVNMITKQSPQFVIWSGHGGEEFMLGPTMSGKKGEPFYISHKDFVGNAGNRIEPYLDMFSKDTTMIVDGCWDKQDNDAITLASRLIQNKIIYPSGETQVKKFKVSKKDGKIDIDIKYNFGAKTRYEKKGNRK